jgi:hypothetical protein
MPCPSNSCLFYNPQNIWWGVKVINLLVIQSSSLLLFSRPFQAQISSSALYSRMLSLRSSLNMKDQVSLPYKTTGNIIILHILNFIVLESKLKDKRFWCIYINLRAKIFIGVIKTEFHIRGSSIYLGRRLWMHASAASNTSQFLCWTDLIIRWKQNKSALVFLALHWIIKKN